MSPLNLLLHVCVESLLHSDLLSMCEDMVGPKHNRHTFEQQKLITVMKIT